MKKHAFRIGLVVTMLLGLMMISANAACTCTTPQTNPHPVGATHDSTDVTWQPLTDMDAAGQLYGYYYLQDEDGDGKVTIAGKITLGGNLTICLNGLEMDFTVTSGDCIQIASEHTLTICDCQETAGSITANHDGNGAVRLINATAGGATVDLWNGTLGPITTTTTTMGTAMYFQGATGYFNMHGGKITGFAKGNAAVYFHKTGTMNMCGGTISNSIPGVFLRDNANAGNNALTFNMTGGTIENTTDGNAITVRVNGIAVNISGDSRVRGEFGKGGNATAPSITITGGSFSGTITGYYDTATYKLTEEVVDGVTYNKVEPKISTDAVALTNEKAAELSYSLTDGDYYLSGALELGTTLTITSGTVNLDLAGYTLTSSATLAVDVASGAILNLEDTSDAATGAIKPASGVTSRGVNVAGTMNMTGGAIDGFNNGSTSGAGVVVSGTFNMSGGAIKNCKTSNNGAGMQIAGGTVNISEDAVLTGNIADGNGGAIATSSAGATINITGGEFSYNKGNGAVVYINGGASGGKGTLTVSDGWFYGNYNVASASSANAPCFYNVRAVITITGGHFGLNPNNVPEPNYATTSTTGNPDDGEYIQALGSVVYIGTGHSKCATYIEGGDFYAKNSIDYFIKKSTVDLVATIEITGGNMNYYVGGDRDDAFVKEGYDSFWLSNPDDANLPYTIAKKFNASSMELKLSGASGFFVRVNFSSWNADHPTFKDDYTAECAGGSIKDLYKGYVDCYVPAKDMFNEMTLTLKNDGRTVNTTTFSVKEYAEKLLADDSKADSLKKAVSDMMRYGDAAQAYFTDGTADKAATVTGLVEGSSWTIADSSDLSADVETQLYQGSSLSLKNNINMNLYFAGNVASVTVNDETVTLAPADNGLQVASVALNLQNAANQLEIGITTSEGTITVYDSIQAYAYRAQNLAVENQALTDLCKAMMNFVLSAKDHFGV